MRRPGLFRLFYSRAMIVLGCSLALTFGLTYYVHTRLIYLVWQDDIQQETNWIASLWTENTRPKDMADNWRMSHDTVRLSVRDPKGRVIADSQPEKKPVPSDSTGLGTLVATAPIPGGELVLSRPGQPIFPLHPEILLILAGLGVATALFFLPLVRGLKSGLERMSGLAARVADGQFGATIEPPRERELAELTLSLNDMSLQLRDQELRQHRLVADVSHELRSPMGRLRALAETVARQPTGARGYLVQIDEEIALMDRLVGDMLEMAQFDEGTVRLKLETVSASAWAADLFQRSRPHIEAAGIRFSSSLSEIDVEARIDPQRLVQAVGNLIDNAIAAVQGCRSPRIALMLEVGLAEWSIIVTDNGRGIPETDLPYVFDRFFRVEKHRGRRGGAGLGLSIARSIAEALQGRIAIESLVDQGTTVRLALRRDDHST
jgi:signal transduction histidine kinase